MFFFGLFSTSAPLVLILVFYLFGIAGIALQQKKVLSQKTELQAKEISYEETPSPSFQKTYHFTEHFVQHAFSAVNTTLTNRYFNFIIEDLAPPISDRKMIFNYYQLCFNKPPPIA